MNEKEVLWQRLNELWPRKSVLRTPVAVTTAMILENTARQLEFFRNKETVYYFEKGEGI